jgi:hypothetical protein
VVCNLSCVDAAFVVVIAFTVFEAVSRCFVLLLPALTFLFCWGIWFRGAREPGLCATASYLGVSLASTTFVSLIGFAVYGLFFALRSPDNRDFLIAAYYAVGLCCAVGVLVAIVGVWRDSKPRWIALTSTLFVLFLWGMGLVLISGDL